MSLALALLAALALTGAPMTAAAEPVPVPLRDYIHTSWTHADGVPLEQVETILQTPDGYLWVFTTGDLLRFDGMRFVRPSTPCTEGIRSQARAADGGFWAVCGGKLIRRTADGRFVVVSEALSNVRQHTLFADREGRVWILGSTIRYLNSNGTDGRVFDGPRAEVHFTAAEDSDGTIWATDRTSIFRLGKDRVEFVQALAGARCLTPARSGGVFVASGSPGTVIWHLRVGAPPSVAADLSSHELSDPPQGCMQEAEGGGWWLAAQRNIVALQQGGELQVLAEISPSQRVAKTIFIDREGTIWVGTSAGLHKFRKPSVRIAAAPIAGQPWFVFADSQANLWAGSSAETNRSSLERARHSPIPGEPYFVAIGEDGTGAVWLSTRAAIGRVTNGGFVAVANATGGPIVDVNAFATDEDGQLWALSKGVGVYRVTPGPPRLVVPTSRAYYRFVVSKTSGIWLGLEDGGVDQHINGRVRFYPHMPADDTGGAMTMSEDGSSIWIGSSTGFERLRNGKWTTWTRAHGLPRAGGVKAMIADRSGHLWMMSDGGLLRVPRAQLDATPDGEPRPLSFARMGLFDGVAPHPGNLATSPTVTADRNGRLYFTTVDAIAIVDPDAIGESSLAPPIVLESVLVDNDPVDLVAAGSFVEPSRLQFEYTSLMLRSPEYARFRYRLEGYDADWIEAGGERRVTYGTLRPGAYRFRVIGAGSEGVWNETGASFAFDIAPVFWRTWWFRLSMVVFGLSIAGVLYRLRVAQLTRQFNRGLEARVGERMRIARELHDTLLQSFQGVLIHFQAATNLLPGRPDVAKQRLEGVLEQAAQAVTEGRDAVQALRESAVPSEDLPEALGVLAAQLVREAGTGTAIPVHVEGRPQRVHPIVRDHVYRIASEAIRNAVRHAQAQVIQVDVHYGERRLQLRIRDDGKGIETAILEGRGVSGHWGLAGMRERAELIGGTLDVRSRAGAGTEVELSLPAGKAYASIAGRRRFWRRSRQADTRS